MLKVIVEVLKPYHLFIIATIITFYIAIFIILGIIEFKFPGVSKAISLEVNVDKLNISNFKMIEKLDKKLGIIPRNRNEVMVKVRKGYILEMLVITMLLKCL
jgi:hypothetical protein